MIEAVLFDIGDTILHSETSKAREFLEVAARPGYDRLCELGFQPPAYGAYLKKIKWALLRAYVWSRIIRREVQIVRAFGHCHRRMGINLDDKQINYLRQLCTQVLRRFITIDDDAVDVITRLHAARLKLGLVSNTLFPSFAIDDFLRYEGLIEYFPVRIYSSDVRYMKPHRKIFRLALNRIGVAAGRTLFVGDHVDKDVWGSSRVGMKTALFVRYGRIPRGRARPDHVIHRLTDLPAILQT